MSTCKDATSTTRGGGGVALVAGQGPHDRIALRFLSLNDNPSIPDAALLEVARLPQLERLGLWGNVRISDAGRAWRRFGCATTY